MSDGKNVEYICSYCGKRITKRAFQGRPDPGNCPRKPKSSDGKYKPHSWVVNRKY